MSLLIFVTASRASRGVVRQPDTQHYLGGSPLLSPARLLKAAVGTGSAAASPMPAVINPLVAAGEFLVEETASDARAPAFDQLFAGSMTEVKNRWAASAVQDSAGEWHLVLSADHVQGVFESA